MNKDFKDRQGFIEAYHQAKTADLVQNSERELK